MLRNFHILWFFLQLKKLRDALGMKYVASYYIKTLFLWKIDELNDPMFWQRDVATIFKIMLKEFYKALAEKEIKYFWNKKNNLLERAPDNIVRGYANKLAKFVTDLENDSNYMCAAKYLLTPNEYSDYTKLLGISQRI